MKSFLVVLTIVGLGYKYYRVTESPFTPHSMSVANVIQEINESVAISDGGLMSSLELQPI